MADHDIVVFKAVVVAEIEVDIRASRGVGA
jgi:hypothetical protein